MMIMMGLSLSEFLVYGEEGLSAKKTYSRLSKNERSLVLNFLRSL
jgi:hypothetical protein